MSGESEALTGDQRPVLRIVSGNPDAADIAAVTVALFRSVAEPEATPAAKPVSGGWSDPAARLRSVLRPGPGAWRSSGF